MFIAFIPGEMSFAEFSLSCSESLGRCSTLAFFELFGEEVGASGRLILFLSLREGMYC
jgi:hypothetical protein